MITIWIGFFVAAIFLAVIIGGVIVYNTRYSGTDFDQRDVMAAVKTAIRDYEDLFEYHDPDTLMTVLQALRKHGVSVKTATNMINTMQNEGIFFRQRKPEELDNGQ